MGLMQIPENFPVQPSGWLGSLKASRPTSLAALRVGMRHILPLHPEAWVSLELNLEV